MIYLKLSCVKTKCLLQIPNAVTTYLYLMYSCLHFRVILFLIAGSLNGKEERLRLDSFVLGMS